MSCHAEIVAWAQVADTVESLNPKLFALLQSIPNSAQKRCILASYDYADLILDRGRVNLSVPQELIGYATVPLGVLVKKSAEVFVEADHSLTPLSILHAGDIFGLFELLDQFSGKTIAPLWSVSAGARTTFLLPKISDRLAHARLRKEFNVPQTPPNELSDHIHVFREIARNPGSKKNWKFEIIFFSVDWIDESLKNSGLFLYQCAWKQSFLARQNILSGLIWNDFLHGLHRRHLNASHYLFSTLKHLFNIAQSAAPGFAVAVEEDLLPLSLLQNAYLNVYQLKKHHPTIMVPAMLGHDKQSAVYYSLAIPTLLDHLPDERERNTSIINELGAIASALTALKNEVYPTYFQNLVGKVKFRLFHTEEDLSRCIHSALELANEICKKEEGEENFSSPNSPFFRGCIELRRVLE